MPDTDLDELPEDATFAGRAPNGRHTWRAQIQRETADAAKPMRFVLYGGGEVRSGWVGGTGDIIATREFRLKNFRLNPVILADHDPTKVIGTGTAEIVQTENGARLEGEPTWDTHESNPLGILIAGQHERGIRKAVSIGFMPGKGSGPRTKLAADHPAFVDPDKVPSWQAGWYHRSPELFEWSSVSVPKDPTALELQSWALGLSSPDQLEAITELRQQLADLRAQHEAIERYVREVLPSAQSDAVLQAVRTNAQVRASIQAAALSALPAAPPTPPAPPAPPDPWASFWR